MDFGLIALCPSRGSISAATYFSALDDGFAGRPCIFRMVVGKPVDEARNELAEIALQIIRGPLPWEVDEVLVHWHDDDATWSTAVMDRALQYMGDDRRIDLLAGNFCQRRPFAPSEGDASAASGHENLVPISSAGFHWVLMRACVLERVGPAPFTPLYMMAEDISFFKRACDAGVAMYMARDLPVGHVDSERGVMYLPNRPALSLNGEALDVPTQSHQQRRSYGAATDEQITNYRLGNSAHRTRMALAWIREHHGNTP